MGGGNPGGREITQPPVCVVNARWPVRITARAAYSDEQREDVEAIALRAAEQGYLEGWHRATDSAIAWLHHDARRRGASVAAVRPVADRLRAQLSHDLMRLIDEQEVAT